MAKIITATVHIEVIDSVAYECFETAKSIGRALFDNYADLSGFIYIEPCDRGFIMERNETYRTGNNSCL